MTEGSKPYYPWQERYPPALGLIPARDRSPLPDNAWRFPDTELILEKWRREQKSVGINMVVVSPNEGELPLKVLSYLLGGLQTAKALRNVGIHISTVRIINPCYLNHVCNDGDLDYQLAYGKNFIEQLKSWIGKHLPGMSDLEVVLDQGAVVQKDKHSGEIDMTLNLIKKKKLYEILLPRMTTHGSGTEQDLALYVLGHPQAWQYTQGGMFISRGSEQGTINCMPQSEMLFLLAMSEMGVDIDPQASGIVTLISQRAVSAPYYQIIVNEPLLDWGVTANDMQNMSGCLRRNSGNHKTAEVLRSLGYLRFFLQNCNVQTYLF